MSVEELEYRQSRLCRSLGNPIAFTVVTLLAEGKETNTSEIARAIGRSVPHTSNILGALMLAEVVRYQTEGRHARTGSNTRARCGQRFHRGGALHTEDEKDPR